MHNISLAASGLLEILLPGPLAVTPALGADTHPAQGVFIEAFITCALILSVLFLAVEKHRATFL
jgi:aquaporin related protein